MKTKPTITNFNLDKYLLLAGIIGPLLFYLIVYFTLPFFYEGYSPLIEGISELGFYDSPVRTATNVLGFSLFGIFIMIFSIGLFRFKEFTKVGKLAAVLLFIGGAMMYLVGIFPGDAGNEQTIRNALHAFFANYQFIPVALSLLLLAYEFSKSQTRSWLIIPIITLGPLSLVCAYYYIIYIGDLGVFQNFRGIIQRLAIGLPYFVVLLIAHNLYKSNKNQT